MNGNKLSSERASNSLSSIGKITRVLPSGFGYVRQQDSGKTFVFSFDAIEGYRGQSVGNLKDQGFKTGTKVKFDNQGDRITSLTVNK